MEHPFQPILSLGNWKAQVQMLVRNAIYKSVTNRVDMQPHPKDWTLPTDPTYMVGIILSRHDHIMGLAYSNTSGTPLVREIALNVNRAINKSTMVKPLQQRHLDSDLKISLSFMRPTEEYVAKPLFPQTLIWDSSEDVWVEGYGIISRQTVLFEEPRKAAMLKSLKSVWPNVKSLLKLQSMSLEEFPYNNDNNTEQSNACPTAAVRENQNS